MIGHLAALRSLARQAAPPPISTLCFQEQTALVLDPARSVVAVCGRRSGKTTAAILRALLEAQKQPDVTCLFIAATRESAKQLGWKVLRAFCRSLGLDVQLGWSDLSATLRNGSAVYLRGVDTEKAAELVRGVHRLAFAAVDEMQRGRPDVLLTLVRDVIRPALRDVRGTLWLLGTPNPRGKTGLLWDRWEAGHFSRHCWTTYHNTKLGSREETEAIVAEDLAAEGETKESAFFRREYLAEWVVDLQSRAYTFDDDRNLYAELPAGLTQSVLGVDLGYRDADAIADLAWSDGSPVQYLRSESIEHGATVNELGARLLAIADQTLPSVIAIDAGGGGAKTLASLQAMLPYLPLQAALKPAIGMQVRALNNRLRHGWLRVRADSRFAADIRQVGWIKGIVSGKIDEEAWHSDIVPAVRYAVLASLPLLPEEPEAAPIGLQAERAARRARAGRAARRHDPLAVEEDGEDWHEAP